MIALRCSGFDRVDLQKTEELGMKVLLNKRTSRQHQFFSFLKKREEQAKSLPLHDSSL